VVVKHVASDEEEVYPSSGSLFAELLEGDEPGLPDSVAGALFEPRDSQTQVEVRCVKEPDH
jgi:hypothetical protein